MQCVNKRCVAGLKASDFTKKKLQHMCFPKNVAKLLRTPIWRTSVNGCFCSLEILLKNTAHQDLLLFHASRYSTNFDRIRNINIKKIMLCFPERKFYYQKTHKVYILKTSISKVYLKVDQVVENGETFQ